MDPSAAPAARILCLDIGNSHINLGCFREGALETRMTLTTPAACTADEAALQLGAFSAQLAGSDAAGSAPFGSAILSSVVPHLTQAWEEAARRFCALRPLLVGPGLKTGLAMRYKNPAEVGSDRIADSVAARSSYGSPCIVVDLGTTTNFCVVGEDGAFLGGIIAPGLRLSAHALAEGAAKLTSVDLHAPKSVIGRTTAEALQSGAVLGEAARIDGLLAKVEEELGYSAPVILSGTDAAAITPLLGHTVHVEPDLTLQGLYLIHQLNRG